MTTFLIFVCAAAVAMLWLIGLMLTGADVEPVPVSRAGADAWGSDETPWWAPRHPVTGYHELLYHGALVHHYQCGDWSAWDGPVMGQSPDVLRPAFGAADADVELLLARLRNWQVAA